MAEDTATLSPQAPADVKKPRPKVTVEDDNSGSEHEEDQQQTSTKNDDENDKESGEEDSSEPIAGSSKDGGTSTTPAEVQNEWQAVWAPAYNAYYFFNTSTKETTWTNPLQPSTEGQPVTQDPPASSSKDATAEDSAPSSSRAAQSSTLIDEAVLNGIDPALAHLDPTLYAARAGGAPPNTFTAKFNARTGRFTAMSDSRDPSYLSEAERAKRMSSVFFDVDKWETDVASRKSKEEEEAAAGTGDKRKRPTKAELDRWKEAKKRKKQSKHAWLLS
ncbi:hypothetical protein M407DRAFT_242317 [Tulasnella calospora MUT 4182]|uniref:WW domain-containing protein n=1 Tax=Tulasnella calospora MUT 4182 TaxID=1051891 RepID=A0A0C3QPC7_9AGAM|nr:hypothetical protein M407DRAFT_242317 [Tulasnella calospora MUT 4182]